MKQYVGYPHRDSDAESRKDGEVSDRSCIVAKDPHSGFPPMRECPSFGKSFLELVS